MSGPTQSVTNNVATNVVIPTALGAAAGAIIGSASGDAGPGAAIGAGLGLLFGSAAGSSYASSSSYQLQREYDAVYLQCMYAQGHRVPAAFVQQRTVQRYYAPSYPPRDYPPPGRP